MSGDHTNSAEDCRKTFNAEFHRFIDNADSVGINVRRIREDLRINRSTYSQWRNGIHLPQNSVNCGFDQLVDSIIEKSRNLPHASTSTTQISVTAVLERQAMRLRRALADARNSASGPRSRSWCSTRSENLPGTTNRNPAITSASASAPHSLPLPPPCLFGRDEVASALTDVLPPTAGDQLIANIVVVSGGPGIGKTALALRWGWDHIADFPDGQLYIDLRGFTAGVEPLTPAAALEHLLYSLGHTSTMSSVDSLAVRYRTILAGQRLLIVLDNAADVDQVLPLIPGSPTSLTIVTSRNPLVRLTADKHALPVHLTPLHPLESTKLLASYLGKHPYRTDSLTQLAELCQHWPFSLWLAIGILTRPRAPSPEEYVSDLRLASRQAWDLCDDHAWAIRGQLDISYYQVSDDAQELLRHFAANPTTDISTQALAAMINMTQGVTELLLAQLSDARMVESTTPGRYALHDVVRVFAREKGEGENPSVAESALRRLANWYTHSAHRAARRIFAEMPIMLETDFSEAVGALHFDSDTDAAEWLRWERLNLVAITVKAAKLDRRLGCELADALRASYWVRPHGIDWVQVAEQALQDAKEESLPFAQAAMHLAVGAANWGIGHFPQARNHFTRAAHTYHQLRRPRAQAAVLLALSAVELATGRLRAAHRHCSASLTLRRQLEDRQAQASTLAHLSEICIGMGQLWDAEKNANDALVLSFLTNYIAGEIAALGILGQVCRETGRLIAARDHYTHQLNKSIEAHLEFRETIALAGLAATHRDLGRYDQALDYASQVVDQVGPHGNHLACIDAFNIIGTILAARMDYSAACVYHEKARDYASRLRAVRGEAEAIIGLSMVASRVGEQQRAVQLARHAYRQIQNFGLRLVEGHAFTALARAFTSAGAPSKAARAERLAQASFRRTGQRGPDFGQDAVNN